MSHRPRGGRRHEDFPDVVERDESILSWVRHGPRHGMPGHSRNSLAAALSLDPRLVRYALDRLRARGLVEHVPKGNEGHGYWAAINTEGDSDGEARGH